MPSRFAHRRRRWHLNLCGRLCLADSDDVISATPSPGGGSQTPGRTTDKSVCGDCDDPSCTPAVTRITGLGGSGPHTGACFRGKELADWAGANGASAHTHPRLAVESAWESPSIDGTRSITPCNGSPPDFCAVSHAELGSDWDKYPIGVTEQFPSYRHYTSEPEPLGGTPPGTLAPGLTSTAAAHSPSIASTSPQSNYRRNYGHAEHRFQRPTRLQQIFGCCLLSDIDYGEFDVAPGDSLRQDRSPIWPTPPNFRRRYRGLGNEMRIESVGEEYDSPASGDDGLPQPRRREREYRFRPSIGYEAATDTARRLGETNVSYSMRRLTGFSLFS